MYVYIYTVCICIICHYLYDSCMYILFLRVIGSRQVEKSLKSKTGGVVSSVQMHRHPFYVLTSKLILRNANVLR